MGMSHVACGFYLLLLSSCAIIFDLRTRRLLKKQVPFIPFLDNYLRKVHSGASSSLSLATESRSMSSVKLLSTSSSTSGTLPRISTVGATPSKISSALAFPQIFFKWRLKVSLSSLFLRWSTLKKSACRTFLYLQISLTKRGRKQSATFASTLEVTSPANLAHSVDSRTGGTPFKMQ